MSKKVLVIVAHPDDEVLGCGGSMAKWTQVGGDVHVIILSEGITSRDIIRVRNKRKEELSVLAKSAEKAADILNIKSVNLMGFPDNRMDSVHLLDVIKEIENIVDILKPEDVVTHHAGDLNIDHRIIHEAVITACRPQPGNPVKRILTFEVPSATEWQSPTNNNVFSPNWFEDISETLDLKIKALNAYQSEMREWPHARSIKAVEYLAKWRGASVGCEAAEAFMLVRGIE